MLSREQAEIQLKPFQIKNWEKTRIRKLSALPVALKTTGLALLGRNPAGKSFGDWQKLNKAKELASEHLQKMSAADRKRLFGIFFPRLAESVEAGWKLHRTLPYETGSHRKGFRAPTDDRANTPARINWLVSLIRCFDVYDPDIVWVATWAAYLNHGYSGNELGILLAAAIDAGGSVGQEIQTILEESASGQHDIGGMGRHVSRALLVCAKPEAWAFVEKLLLAAQRQEGLRQVILESIDEAHPGAFKRMLRLILEKNLLRFASTVRAVDVWFGLQWTALTPAVLKRTVEQALLMLEDPSARDAVIASDRTEALYLALYAIAFEDAHAAIEPAAALLADEDIERRFIAATLLGDLGLPAARTQLVACLDDADLRIVMKAVEHLPAPSDGPQLWDRLVTLLGRMPPRRQEGEALIWPWATTTIDRSRVASELVTHLGNRPATALLPFMHDLNSYQRGNVIEQLAKMKSWDAATRDTLFSLVGDRDGWVRQKALQALKKCTVTAEDAQRIEGALVRKGGDLRQGALALLVKQKPTLALASADRLLASKKPPQRVAGLELLRVLVEKKRAVAECRERATAYQQKYAEPTEEEQLQLDIILDIERVKPKLDDSFGLTDASGRSRAIEPKSHKVVLCTPAVVALLEDLDALVRKNKETPITIDTYSGAQEQLLGNVQWGFPSPRRGEPIERDVARLPLRTLWDDWFANRPRKLRDADGLELLRASVWMSYDKSDLTRQRKMFGKEWGPWLKLLANEQPSPKLKYQPIVRDLIAWLLRLHPPAGAIDFLLNVVETGFAHVPAEARARVVDVIHWQKRDRDWRINSPLGGWLNAFEQYRHNHQETVTAAHRLRLWQLMHWRDQPAPGVARMRPELSLLVEGTNAGQTTEADLYDQILGPGDSGFAALRELSTPGRIQTYNCPPLAPVVERCVERILEIELTRGEMPTPASSAAQAIQSLTGLSTLLRVLRPLDKKPLARNSYGESKAVVLTHLVKVTRPGHDDTPELFAEQTKKAGIFRERLLQLAFAAPQWLDHIEHTLGWPGLKEGVWWFLVHMPGGHSGLDPNVEPADYDEFDDFDETDQGAPIQQVNPWEAIIRERTPLSAEDRAFGAVDAGWFHRAYEPLGRKRWDMLAGAARHGCDGQGFKKAIRLGDVLLARTKKADLIHEVRIRKFKESVRLFGLLPLPIGPRREAELMSRYKILVEYRRYARSLSPMSREDAERTATIGLENLARTAGYADPIRLEWAMEAKQIADLAAGPVAVTAEGVTVTLSIDNDAQLQMTVQRGDRILKAVPPLARKSPKMAAHLERRADIRRQGSRVKQTLEAMMVRGDTFAGRELRQMFIHPLLRPLLERLVIVGEGIRGYPIAEGQALENHAGKREPIKQEESLRIAHAYDLFEAGDWDQWQTDCFRDERVQPFKQVFRELYVVTAQEKADGASSSRYASQQVNPAQAMALWGGRGWNTREGVEKTFFQEGIVASVSISHHGWTAAEVSGLTLDTITFRRRGEWRPMPLADVPPRLFSEVMRDCDLVVSVAHVGGIDPEASASTVQMREALIRETCAVLRIDNYEVKGTHILITGKLGRYSVHLGSGVVHRQPGGSLCIVAVQAQQRGRLFLPFADDDPRTAEVISKIMLLARDHEIQDPSILEQLR